MHLVRFIILCLYDQRTQSFKMDGGRAGESLSEKMSLGEKKISFVSYKNRKNYCIFIKKILPIVL